MTPSQIKTRSKFLSLILRHNPARGGITLDNHGWVRVDTMLKALALRDRPMSREELDEIVETNNKQRFAYSDDGTLIRASQGHSVKIDLDLKPQVPPDVLYHGTTGKSVNKIFNTSLQKMGRQHVHLSSDIVTAAAVGSRHGKAVILTVDTLTMHNDGCKFYLSANGVWLTDNVPAKYLKVLDV